MGAEVSRVQLHLEPDTEAADRAESGAPVQGTSPRADATDTRGEHGENGRGSDPLSTGLDRLFRQVRNAERAAKS